MCQTIYWWGGVLNSDASVTDVHAEVHLSGDAIA